MPTLKKSLRAPADLPKTGIFEPVAAVLTWLLWPVIGCRHRNPSIPINDHQTCLDCGATRLYLFHTDFEHADAGIFIGKWKKAVRPQSAHRVIAKTLIDNAIIPARRPLDGRAAVLNPGSESALFQPQPREKAVRA